MVIVAIFGGLALGGMIFAALKKSGKSANKSITTLDIV